jgi:hypothetical protein
MRKWEKKGARRRAHGSRQGNRTEAFEFGSGNVEAEGIAHGAKEKKKVRRWEKAGVSRSAASLKGYDAAPGRERKEVNKLIADSS